MDGGDGCIYVGIDVNLGWVIASWRSLRILFTLILIGIALPGCLVSFVLRFAYCILCFEKK